MEIKRQIRSTPQVGYAPYRQIHPHSTGNSRSTAQNESDNQNNNRPEAFFTHVVGNGEIIQIAETGRGAYDVGGGWNYETYAAVELIESHSTKEEFEIDYRLYVNLLRQLADEANIPKTLDTADLSGIKTHMYCTYHQPNNGSDHIDPYPYLNKWGVTVDQFEKDLANGFTESGSNTSNNENEETQKPKTKEEITMICFYQVDKKGPVYYFDGQSVRGLAHQDEQRVLNDIYRANNGKDIPTFQWTSKAPWHARLLGVVNRKPMK
ncbi:N-acetylmuramoyl-L-alanine amidase [Enterococcus ureilyticus]|uniref:N-acetylmuramoyl-L-alanine amidase n=1 Tax=Enterococcus ureilyticus TaxID=1131292 RepID=UPI001A9353B3|nr:N-acetylmuramoyl-L-alanine amidase [Enterococcus ureilyticus]MBO0445545.1 N-acetylmuramoyl-L-alanine amidase [Enterococcus ureilyticus]